MMWLALAVVAALVLSPLAHVLLRPAAARGRAEADVALYQAQLAELDAQRDEGRLTEQAHRAATLEVQRRLLAAPPPTTAKPATPLTKAIIAATLLLVPAGAVSLYLTLGFPEMPSAGFTERREAQARDDELITTLRERLSRADPTTEVGRQGFILLGNAERSRGRWAEAAEAWTRALNGRFDAGLAADLAEIEIERGETDSARNWLTRALEAQPGDPRLRFLTGLAEARAGRNEIARSTWRALLADAPRDAPWRELVEDRLRRLP
ncbi:MAG: c-type cytochrome biogenesis protein CcmI [Acetobacteraceae bacterium]|nr:c-type cytochrome biogenesis protein CcmI [Acetobacteraceae bacterium]